MKKLRVFISIVLLAAMSAADVFGCTSAVISGKITPDGRPLLWKHRDTDFRQNSVRFFRGQKFSFIAVVNSVAGDPGDIWIGTNNAGFSIMNTQSFNLEEVENDDERGMANGRVMRRALEICATVQDFCHFLDTLAKPSDIEANFGVIDAQGGALMLEVDYNNYTVFDANNPKDAPYGYIARTNFSFCGKINEGFGYIRYMTVEQEMIPAAASMMLTPQWIFKELARSFKNPRLGIDLRSGDFNRPKTSGWFIEQDFISRKSSASTVVIKGVKKGEKPELTTMWTVLGYPPASVALPLWVKNADRKLPKIATRDEKTGVAAVCDWATRLADKAYCYDQGSGSERYFNWELLFNTRNTGFMQKLEPVEDEIFGMTGPVLDGWYEKGRCDVKEMEALYDRLDSYVTESYRTLFSL